MNYKDICVDEKEFNQPNTPQGNSTAEDTTKQKSPKTLADIKEKLLSDELKESLLKIKASLENTLAEVPEQKETHQLSLDISEAISDIKTALDELNLIQNDQDISLAFSETCLNISYIFLSTTSAQMSLLDLKSVIPQDKINSLDGYLTQVQQSTDDQLSYLTCEKN